MTETIGLFRSVGRTQAEGTAASLGEARLRALGADFEAALGEHQRADPGSETPSAEREVAEREVAEHIARGFAIGALFREAFNREWGK